MRIFKTFHIPLFVVTLVESKTGSAVKQSGLALCLADRAKRRQFLPTLTAFGTKLRKECYSLIDAVRTLAEACKAFAAVSLVALVIETYTQFFFHETNYELHNTVMMLHVFLQLGALETGRRLPE